jgi:hypothetical protein
MCFLQRVLPVNRVLLPGERTGLAQAGTAPQFSRGGDAGIPLFLGQGVAVFLRGGTEPGSGAQLRGGARVVGADVKPANLFAVAHKPYPVAAPPAFDDTVKTSS